MSTPDEFLAIDTPENVVFGYEIVGIGSRFIAALIDSLIIGIVYGIVILALFFVIGNFVESDSLIGSFIVGLFGLLGFLFIWGYYIFFEMAWNGRSPGKQLVGLRVIRRDGTPVTLAESIIRNLIRLVDFLPFAYGVGVVTMFIDSKSRRLGDMAASTLVVRDHEDVTLESLTEATIRPLPDTSTLPSEKTKELVKEWPLERLQESDIQLAEEFLRRYKKIENRDHLAAQIFLKLMNQMEITEYRTDYDYLNILEKLQAIVNMYRQQQ